MSERISREQMFMDIAHTVAKRGTCDRARVGAVLVHHKSILSIGYNGAPSGEPHCDEADHIMYNGHCIRSIHAEENCINKAILPLSQGFIMYVTHYPCIKCQAVMYEAMCRYNGKLLVYFNEIYGERTEFEKICKDRVQFARFVSDYEKSLTPEKCRVEKSYKSCNS